MTPEGRIRSHLRKQAIAAGFEHRKLRWIGRRGAPDELLFWPVLERTGPVFAYIEVKRPGEEVDYDSPQGREITRLRRAGFFVTVIDSLEGADSVIESLTTLVQSRSLTR